MGLACSMSLLYSCSKFDLPLQGAIWLCWLPPRRYEKATIYFLENIRCCPDAYGESARVPIPLGDYCSKTWFRGRGDVFLWKSPDLRCSLTALRYIFRRIAKMFWSPLWDAIHGLRTTLYNRRPHYVHNFLAGTMPFNSSCYQTKPSMLWLH